MFKWVNMFLYAQVEGLVYFNAYVNQTTNEIAGWVTRTEATEPYSYNVYWPYANGISIQTRGTWQHALWAVEGAVAANG